MRASLQDEAKLKEYGYSVEPWGKGWILLDPEGYSLQVSGHGGISPTRWEAVAEGLDRINQG
jgi:hypothetical protein